MSVDNYKIERLSGTPEIKLLTFPDYALTFFSYENSPIAAMCWNNKRLLFGRGNWTGEFVLSGGASNVINYINKYDGYTACDIYDGETMRGTNGPNDRCFSSFQDCLAKAYQFPLTIGEITELFAGIKPSVLTGFVDSAPAPLVVKRRRPLIV